MAIPDYGNYFSELLDITRGLSSTKKEFALLLLVLVCFFLLVNNSWKASPDSALYLELGECLAKGSGYRFNGELHTYVPPGFPGLVSLTVNAFGKSFLVYRVMMCLLGIATSFVGYFLIFRLLGRDMAFLIGGLFALNNTLLSNSSYVTSDVLFTFVGLASLLAVSSLQASALGVKPLVLTGLLSGTSALVRINGWGIPVSSGLFLYSSLNRRPLLKRICLSISFVFLGFVVPLLWELHKRGYPRSYNEGEYLNAITGRTLATQISIIFNSAWGYVAEMATALMGVSIKTGFLEVFIVAFVALGFWVAWKRGERLFIYLTAIQLGGLLLSPAGSRYILLLIPGLLLFLFQGVIVAGDWLRKHTALGRVKSLGQRRAILAVAILLLATNMGQNAVTISQARLALESGGAETDRDEPFFVAARWLKSHAEGKSVLTMNPRIIRYLTGLPTVEMLRSGSPEEMVLPKTLIEIRGIIQKRNPAFLFLDNRDEVLKGLIIAAAESLNYKVEVIKEASCGDRYILARLSAVK
ncbi:MAG: ArnT family glycosyltransferase [Desulfomonilaceae bacterium]